MEKIDELKRRLGSLQRSPIYAKPAAAEDAIVCAVEVLDELAQRVECIEQLIPWADLEKRGK